MDNENLKVGNVDHIKQALASMAHIEIHDDEVTVYTDVTKIEKLRAEMRTEQDKSGLFGVDRDRILHRFQEREYSMGAWSYRLGTSMYGYTVGDMLKSNIGGGRFNQIHRGATLSEAIVWGCEQAKRKNVRFSFPRKHFPL